MIILGREKTGIKKLFISLFCLTQNAIRCLLEFFRVQEFFGRGYFLGRILRIRQRGWFRFIRQAVSIRLNPWGANASCGIEDSAQRSLTLLYEIRKRNAGGGVLASPHVMELVLSFADYKRDSDGLAFFDTNCQMAQALAQAKRREIWCVGTRQKT